MISQKEVNQQLKKLNVKRGMMNAQELSELHNILTPSENISKIVNGYYENGMALLVSTDHRMLLIDKKPFSFLNVEDFRFDMINQLDYRHRLMNSAINVSAGPKNLKFTSWDQKNLRQLIDCVQCRMIEIKEEKKDAAEKQHSKLDQLDQTLKAYIQSQLAPSDPEKGVNVMPTGQPSFDSSTPDDDGLSSQMALDDYLKRVNQPSEGYIKSGSLLPKVDLNPAKIAFAKLPGLISSRKRFSSRSS